MNATKELLTTAYFNSNGTGFDNKVLLWKDKIHIFGNFQKNGVYRSTFVNTRRFVNSNLKKFLIGKNNRVFYICNDFIFNENKKLIAINIDNIIQIQFGHFTKPNELKMVKEVLRRWQSNVIIEYVEDLDSQYIGNINFNVKTLSAKKELEKQIFNYVRNN